MTYESYYPYAAIQTSCHSTPTQFIGWVRYFYIMSKADIAYYVYNYGRGGLLLPGWFGGNIETNFDFELLLLFVFIAAQKRQMRTWHQKREPHKNINPQEWVRNEEIKERMN